MNSTNYLKGDVMKKFNIMFILLGTITLSTQAGQLTNNGSVQVNVVMYGNNYKQKTDKKSAQGRLNDQGIIIPAGQNVNFLPGTSHIEVYYGNGTLKGSHFDIVQNTSYTLYPGSPEWSMTQD